MNCSFKPSWKVLTVFIFLLLALDQVSKILIKCSMTIGETIYVFGEWFQIKFIENPGAAYGFEISDGEWGKLLLSLIRVVAICALTWYINKLIKEHAPKGVVVGFALILAGALGNLIDSMFYAEIFTASTFTDVAHCVPWGEGYGGFMHGKVVDMLYFPIINTEYPSWMPVVGGDRFIFFSPIFNIADSYISIGFLYLIIFQRKFFNKKEEEQTVIAEENTTN